MALLGISIAGVMTALNHIQRSQTDQSARLKNLSEQSLLDRAIWNKLNEYEGAISDCGGSGSYPRTIYFDTTTTCKLTSNNGGNHAIIHELFTASSAAVPSAPSAPQITLAMTSATNATRVQDLIQRHESRIQFLGFNNNSPTSFNACGVQMVSASGSQIDITLSNLHRCSAAQRPTSVILPRYLIEYKRGINGVKDDGLVRVFY